MQYMLMFYQPQSEFDQRDEAAAQAYRAHVVHPAGAVGLGCRLVALVELGLGLVEHQHVLHGNLRERQ